MSSAPCERESPHRLDEAQVVADAQPDPAERQFGHRQPEIAGLEARASPPEQVELPVVQRDSVGADEDRGVEQPVAVALAEAAGDPAAAARAASPASAATVGPSIGSASSRSRSRSAP